MGKGWPFGSQKRHVENKKYVILFETSGLMSFRPSCKVFENHTTRSRIDSTVGYTQYVATAFQTILIRRNPLVKLHTSVCKKIRLRCTRFYTSINHVLPELSIELWPNSIIIRNVIKHGLAALKRYGCRPFSRFRRTRRIRRFDWSSLNALTTCRTRRETWGLCPSKFSHFGDRNIHVDFARQNLAGKQNVLFVCRLRTQ